MSEARKINDAWLHHCSSKNLASTVQLDDENPFIEDPEQVATRHGYVYKVWKIPDEDEDRKICIRCAVHTHTGKIKPDGERQFQNVYAVNEHDLQRTNWRSQIDTSLISCLTRELTDNSFKVSRWLV